MTNSTPASTETLTQDKFLKEAKRLAANHAGLKPEDVYVVWFDETLGSRKALVRAGDALNGPYWEVNQDPGGRALVAAISEKKRTTEPPRKAAGPDVLATDRRHSSESPDRARRPRGSGR